MPLWPASRAPVSGAWLTKFNTLGRRPARRAQYILNIVYVDVPPVLERLEHVRGLATIVLTARWDVSIIA